MKLLRDKIGEALAEEGKAERLESKELYIISLFNMTGQGLNELSMAGTEEEVFLRMGEIDETWNTLKTMLLNTGEEESTVARYEAFSAATQEVAKEQGGYFGGWIEKQEAKAEPEEALAS